MVSARGGMRLLTNHITEATKEGLSKSVISQ